jgi:hypothetical protein
MRSRPWRAPRRQRQRRAPARHAWPTTARLMMVLITLAVLATFGTCLVLGYSLLPY